MLTREQFAKGPVHVPLPVKGDAYTVASQRIVSPEASMKSVYNFTNRKSPVDALPKGVAKDGRMCLYGLTDFIQRELSNPVTSLDVGISELFMRTAGSDGKALDFDIGMWNQIVDEYDGRLPIRIDALPEGSTFWMNEPVIQVTSLSEGFGEIVALVEGMLVGYVANATARLTLTRHLLDRVRNVVKSHHRTWSQQQVDAVAQWMIHDFGMRASSTPQEAEIYGRAHLLCFNGTDTFSAAFQAWANNADRPVGTSILALAHRIVMGYAKEDDAYQALMAATIGSMGSYVSDCYEFHNAVSKFLVSIAKRGETTVVARPDSGDYLENVLFIVDKAMEHELYAMDENGKPKATSLRFIQGDSMNWEKIQRIFMHLEKKNVDPTGWGIFGIGGWLRNTPNRDTLSSAYKLCAYGRDNKSCVKLSDTLAKVSVPGPSEVMRPNIEGGKIGGPTVYLTTEVVDADDEFHPDTGHETSALKTFYDGSKPFPECFESPCLEDFNDVRNRVLKGFDEFAYVPSNRGTPENPCLSRKILKLQQDTMRKYGKNVADYCY